MDRSHESMAIRKKTNKKNEIIGGVVYKLFLEKKFAEIAFLAITSLEQVKGHGTKLMNKLKAHLQKLQIQHMLTYADNNAVGYFKKQGFSTISRMPKEQWCGYIKSYDSGTLMDCYINPYIDYEELPNMLTKQKADLMEEVKKIYNFKIIKGSELYKKDIGVKKKKTEEDLSLERVFNKIPGLSESGWDLESYKESM